MTHQKAAFAFTPDFFVDFVDETHRLGDVCSAKYGCPQSSPITMETAANPLVLRSTVAGRSEWTHLALHTVQSLERIFNSAHAEPGPGYPSALVSLERMLCRLTPLRGGTASRLQACPDRLTLKATPARPGCGTL